MIIEKPPLGLISHATKITALVLLAGLIAEKATHLNDLHPDPLINLSLISLALMMPAFWLSLIVPGAYLTALWAAGDVFARLDKGDAFGPAAVKGLRDVGSNLMFAGFAAIVLVPTITPVFEDRFRGIRYEMGIEPLTIGLIGLLLWLLTTAGARLQSDMESFV